MNVAFAGSHDIELTRDIASKIAAFMVILAEENNSEVAMWGESNAVAVRAPAGTTQMGPIEKYVMRMAAEMDLSCMWYRPQSGFGRSATFDRDYTMVQGCHRVVAFFRPERLMEGGTGHLVHAALVKGIPVEAWTFTDEGNIACVGSDDGFEVGAEGSAWMQHHFLEWNAAQVEQQMQDALWKTVRDTATPMVVTSDRTTLGQPMTIGPGKIWVGGSWVGNGTISVSSGSQVPLPYSVPSPNQNFTVRRSG